MWDRPIAAVRGAWRRLAARVSGWARRLLRRPPPQITGEAIFVQGAGSVRARGRVQYPPVDPSDLPTATAELDRRLREVVDRHADLQERVQDEGEASLKAARELSERLDREVEELRSRDQSVAIGGIYWETLGLLVTGVGLVLQALAS